MPLAFVCFPSLLSSKKPARMAEQVADHLVPNQVLGFFEFFRERERGKFCVFKGLQKAFIGADSRKLKMRRPPPTLMQFYATPRSGFFILSSAYCK
jgi:hypothetical protein